MDPSTNIPTQSSSADEWQAWVEECMSQFGTAQGKALFVKAWHLRGSSSANTLAFRTYLKKYGIQIDESIFDSAVDLGSSITDTIGGIFTFGKYTTYAIVGVAVLGSALIIYNIARNPGRAVGTTLKYAK